MNIKISKLKNAVEGLQIGFFVAEASTVTENLLTPFTGSQRDLEAPNGFKLCLIEMEFGLLVKNELFEEV